MKLRRPPRLSPESEMKGHMKTKMKQHMKTIMKLAFVLGFTAAIFMLNGCATSEKPNYQGHKGVSPTVQDYYPSKKPQ